MYAVLLNGKDTGIIETNYEFASKYWESQSFLGAKFTLNPLAG